MSYGKNVDLNDFVVRYLSVIKECSFITMETPIHLSVGGAMSSGNDTNHIPVA